MIPLIRMLDLEGKTEDEIRRKMFVDFRTLPSVMPTDPEMQAKVLLAMYKMQLHPENIRATAETLHPSDRVKYDLKRYNNGIVALGVQNFMTAAAQFCEDEAAGGGEVDIVSIGSGDGTIEKDIAAEYRSRFGKDMARIRLVDPDPKFDGIVDFKTVDHLIRESPNMVDNCVAFMIWPLPVSHELLGMGASEPYDIEAIRKLQPKAVFIVYECMGGSGSNDLRIFLRDDKLETLSLEERGTQNWLAALHHKKTRTHGLDNYSITEIAHQKIRLPRSGTLILRMVKLKREG